MKSYGGYGLKIKLSDYDGIWVWHSNLWFHNCLPLEIIETKTTTKELVKDSLKQHHTILVDYYGTPN